MLDGARSSWMQVNAICTGDGDAVRKYRKYIVYDTMGHG